MAIQVRPSKNPEFKTWTCHDLLIISNMHPGTNVCGADTLSDGRGMTRHLVNTNWCDVIDMTWSLPQWDWNWNHTFMGTGDTIPAAVGCNPCARLSPVLFLLLSWHLAWWTTPCQKEYCIQQFNTITSCMYSYEYRCSEVWRRKRLWITYPSNGFPSLACCINARGGHQWEGKTRVWRPHLRIRSVGCWPNDLQHLAKSSKSNSVFGGELDDCMMSLWRDKSYAVFIYFHTLHFHYRTNIHNYPLLVLYCHDTSHKMNEFGSASSLDGANRPPLQFAVVHLLQMAS